MESKHLTEPAEEKKTKKTAAASPAPKAGTKTGAAVKADAKTPAKSAASAAKTSVKKSPAPASEFEAKTVGTVSPVKKLLFVGTECQPFIATGGLGEVMGSLPKAIARDKGFDVRVVLPLYSDIPQNFRRQMRYVGNTYASLSWRKQYCGIFVYEQDNVTYYFIDNEYYFKRSGIYGHFDDGERFAFFSKSVFEMFSVLDYVPDVIHANDWQSALVPIYLKTIYREDSRFSRLRTVYTIHNIEYQGKYSLNILEDIFGIPKAYGSVVEYDGLLNLMKGAIQTCDILSTVSKTYAKEILSPYYSHGLLHILKSNEYKIRGILNGIDTVSYDPSTDPALFAHFDAEHPEGKAADKAELQKLLNLPVEPDIPIVAMISRLVPHKGIDLVKEIIEDVLKMRVQFVVLGKGDSIFENFFLDMQKIYSEKMRTLIMFNQDLSRKIYAGADLFLMPSKSEPCGLSQMIASRYGTVPVVRETGGLADSIQDIGCEDGGNGFTFLNYNAYDLLNRIKCAMMSYEDREKWSELVEKVMRIDFSWNKSAREYINMYQDIVF